MVNYSKMDLFFSTKKFDNFRLVLKIKTIYVKKWGNYF